MANWNKQLAGDEIRGRWTHHTYRFLRYLGEGATGTVYLVKEMPTGQLRALKMSEGFYTISAEVNVLKKLNQSAYNYRGPQFYNVDDGTFLRRNKKVYFYTMEYIDGVPYRKYIEKNGQEWSVVFLLQILRQLSVLHQAGWAFGDLKVDNIIISKKKPEVRWFDVGGFTPFGRSIKEYTEFYDQGYWGIGTRRASVQYDLFACSMIFIEAFYPKRFYRGQHNGKYLLRKKIGDHPELRWFLPIMEKLWKGYYQSATQMRSDIHHVYMERLQRVKSYNNHKKTKRKKRTFRQMFVKTGMVLLFIIGGYILYLFYWVA